MRRRRMGHARVAALSSVTVAGIAALLYLRALGGDFVWDDHVLADGSAIGGGGLGACFTTAFLGHYYRPLVSLSFYFDRLWWPGNTVAYHLVGIGLHVLSTVAVLGLLRSLYGAWSVALAGALLYCVHPANVGAVAWIGGRTDALGGLWTALFAWGLIEAARSIGDRRSLALAGAVCAFALAVFTKEQSLALLPLVPLAFAAFVPRRGSNLPGTPVFALGPFVVVAAFYLAMGIFLGMPKPQPSMLTWSEHLERVGQILCGYGLLLLAPNQTILHTYSLARLGEAMPWSAITGYALLTASLAALWRLWRTDRGSAWLLAMSLLALLPVSGLVPMPFLLFAPYRAAVSAIGVAGLLARLTIYLRLPVATMSRIPAILALSILSFWFTIQTVTAMDSYRTESSFFAAMLRYDPGATVGRLALVQQAVAEGRDADAEAQLTAILDWLFGRDTRAWNWHDPRQAHEALRRSRRVRAQVTQDRGAVGDAEDFACMLFVQLGYARMGQAQWPEAQRAFETALGWRPSDVYARTGIAWCLLNIGRPAEAERHLKIALEADPGSADARRLLAHALEYQGRHAEAQQHWVRLQQKRP